MSSVNELDQQLPQANDESNCLSALAFVVPSTDNDLSSQLPSVLPSSRKSSFEQQQNNNSQLNEEYAVIKNSSLQTENDEFSSENKNDNSVNFNNENRTKEEQIIQNNDSQLPCDHSKTSISSDINTNDLTDNQNEINNDNHTRYETDQNVNSSTILNEPTNDSDKTENVNVDSLASTIISDSELPQTYMYDITGGEREEQENKSKTDVLPQTSPTNTLNANINRSETLKSSKLPSKLYQRLSSYSNHYQPQLPQQQYPYFYYQSPPLPTTPMDIRFSREQHPPPLPLMFITPSSRSPDSATTLPTNLPPRLRQTSYNEDENGNRPEQQQQINGGRPRRNVLPRFISFSPHPPQPLMTATPPAGLLFPFHPAFHPNQPLTHIAYNISSPPINALRSYGSDDYLQYHMQPSLPASLLLQSNSISLLNPDAPEWIPASSMEDLNELSENTTPDITVDQENFPELKSTNELVRTDLVNQKNYQTIDEESSTISDHEKEILITSNTSPVDQLLPSTSSSSSQESTSLVKHVNTNQNSQLQNHIKSSRTISYSNIIAAQTSQSNQQQPRKSTFNKTKVNNNSNNNNYRRQPQHFALPPRDRQQQRFGPSNPNNKNKNDSSRRLINNIKHEKENVVQNLPDDWIEVRSKSKKKFDRTGSTTEDIWKMDDDQSKQRSTPAKTSDISKSSPPTQTKQEESPLLVSTQQNNTVMITKTSIKSSDEEKSVSPSRSPNTTSEDEQEQNEIEIVVENGEKEESEQEEINEDTTIIDYDRQTIQNVKRMLENGDKLFILMRGCPGSGKSTLANLTVELFLALESIKNNITPIIIDNTNTTSWEMKPYATMAKEAGYNILIIEPHTPWKYKARELFKRNAHNVPLRRIKDMLMRFEHNISVKSLLEPTLSTMTTTITQSQQQLQLSLPQRTFIQRNYSSPMTTTTTTTLINIAETIPSQEVILNDVKSCIDDMILFITSNFYQAIVFEEIEKSVLLSIAYYWQSWLFSFEVCITIFGLPLSFTIVASTAPCTSPTSTAPSPSQPTSPQMCSISFYDYPLNSTTPTSLLSNPLTPHHRFHRSLSSRFSTSATTVATSVQDGEHILRLPSTTFPRCDPLPSKTKKKNKNKRSVATINENINNNNNNVDLPQIKLKQISVPQPHYEVFMEEDFVDRCLVIDETIQHTEEDKSKNTITNNSWLNNLLQHGVQTNAQIRISISVNNIAISELNSMSSLFSDNSSLLLSDGSSVAIASSSNDACLKTAHPFASYERGTQLDLLDENDDSLSYLNSLYSSKISSELISQFYKLCMCDLQRTKSQLDKYLLHLHPHMTQSPISSYREENYDSFIETHTNKQQKQKRQCYNEISSLKQYCLDVLNEWNLFIKDINDDDRSLIDYFDELIVTNDASNLSTDQEYTKYLIIPEKIIDSMKKTYGELLEDQSLSTRYWTTVENNCHDEILLSIDNDLAITLYQTIQKHILNANNATALINVNHKQQQQQNNSKTAEKLLQKNQLSQENSRWYNINTIDNGLEENMKTSHTDAQSLKRIIIDEKRTEKHSQLKHRSSYELDDASELKLKCLEIEFPQYSRDLIYQLFDENEFNYELTLASITSMLNKNISSQSYVSALQMQPITKTYSELRFDALKHGQIRKQMYKKAYEAIKYGEFGSMTGVASFYIDKANDHFKLMKHSNQNAYEKLSEYRRERFIQTQQLNLHGFYCNEALHLVQSIIQESISSSDSKKNEFEIITDRNKNSSNGDDNGKIRTTIINYLKLNNYSYSEPHKGIILLKLSKI
ncbi:unnamed protein product [Didymodactylos carnosus]|uniref:Smr domain-containing protein n=1 Tax=Didymodactylos carnosus TaxID=1234261 RepID=A0A8S2DA69_9BILA|nr:unnamed protein product [Didymodactylos carnosus]CAF3696847.1 unnamed protein product [Didymodactylos carnosus]